MKTIYTLLIILLPTSILFSQIRGENDHENQYYKGDITIERLNGKIVFQSDGKPNATFQMKTSGKYSERDFISFRGGEKSSLNGNELAFKPHFTSSGKLGKTQNFKFEITPTINDLIPVNPISETRIEIELPENFVFIRSNQNLKMKKEGKITFLTLDLKEKYITPLVLVMNTNGKGLSIQKEIQEKLVKKGSPATFVLNVSNIGNKTLDNIVIEDNFDPRDFGAEGSEFEPYKGKDNDARVIWRSTIQSLKPGESLQLTYKTNALNTVKYVSLDSAKATVDGELVGVSNKIEL